MTTLTEPLARRGRGGVPILEPCLPDAPMMGDTPVYGGRLFFHQESRIAGCPGCGWCGVPTTTGGDVPTIRFEGGREVRRRPTGTASPIISTRCPACERGR